MKKTGAGAGAPEHLQGEAGREYVRRKVEEFNRKMKPSRDRMEAKWQAMSPKEQRRIARNRLRHDQAERRGLWGKNLPTSRRGGPEWFADLAAPHGVIYSGPVGPELDLEWYRAEVERHVETLRPLLAAGPDRMEVEIAAIEVRITETESQLDDSNVGRVLAAVSDLYARQCIACNLLERSLRGLPLDFTAALDAFEVEESEVDALLKEWGANPSREILLPLESELPEFYSFHGGKMVWHKSNAALSNVLAKWNCGLAEDDHVGRCKEAMKYVIYGKWEGVRKACKNYASGTKASMNEDEIAVACRQLEELVERSQMGPAPV